MDFPLSTKDRRGNTIKLEEKDWLHILLRHEEVGDDPLMLLSCARDSYEVYLDKEGIMHYVNPVYSKHFIVVICEVEKVLCRIIKQKIADI